MRSSSQNNINIRHEVKSPIVVRFNKVTNSTTLASDATKHTRIIEVVDATGISTGSYLILFNSTDGSLGFYIAANVNGTTITLDNLLEYDFLAGTDVDVSIVFFFCYKLRLEILKKRRENQEFE